MRKRVLKGSLAVSIGIVVVALLTVVIDARISMAQGRQDLEARHQRLLPLFELDGIVYTDADESTDRLVVGVANRGLETAVRARLTGLGVSPQSVDVLVAEPIYQLTTLQDYLRPIEGGLQTRWDGYLCTIGFNGVRAGVAGFAMNSHCTTKQGGVNGTKYYQPLEQLSGDLIGTEIADPLYLKNIAGCPRGKLCRRSDSAYAQRAPGVSPGGHGFIAKTDSVNTGSLTIAGQFRIAAKVYSAVVGETVNKVGRTTGWTQGKVTNTCVDTSVSGTNIVQLCQNFVSAAVGGGDSSSPVFAIIAGTSDVELRGMLWGGNSAGTQFVYSPIANIEAELGAISVCAGGGC